MCQAMLNASLHLVYALLFGSIDPDWYDHYSFCGIKCRFAAKKLVAYFFKCKGEAIVNYNHPEITP